MAACTTYHCDICGQPIESGRTRIEVTIGNLAGTPTDISTGRIAADLCPGCRDWLARRLTNRATASSTAISG